jgi:Icc-related predicted phosphoesterase
MNPTRDSGIVRVAAVGDLHCRKDSAGAFGAVFSAANELADVLLLCGDLTDYGTLEEANVLAKELLAVRVPMLAVLGNHDYESGKADEVAAVLRQAGVKVLGSGDADSVEVHGIGFAGAKGFCGGFGAHTLGHWGEPAIKRFVQESIDEALKLEGSLARLRTNQKVVLLHYSPVRGTLEGEPLEIFPYLGCSRLEEPLLRYPVSVVFHGHAHRGQPEGRTANGTPVYNVALPLLKRTFTGKPPLRVLELQVASSEQLVERL